MLFDANNLFSDKQAVTDTAVSTNVVDFLPNSPLRRTPYGTTDVEADTGRGNPVPVRVQVTTSFATLTSLKVELQTSDTEGSGYTSIAESPTIVVANLKAGKWINLDFMYHEAKRFLRLNYVVTGTTATAGAVTAGIVAAHQSNPAHAA